MGRNNRQRRAEKVRKRQRASSSPRGASSAGHGPGAGFGAGPPPSGDRWLAPGERFVVAVQAQLSGDQARAARAVDVLAGEETGRVARAVVGHLEHQVADLWELGWQPADVERIVARRLGRSEATLTCRVIVAQSATYEARGRRVAPGWMAQVDRLEPRRPSGTSGSYLRQLDVAWPDALWAAVRLDALLSVLPRLAPLIDPPTRWRDGPRVDAETLPAGVLSKVRALLSKAESTTFEPEAEALTTKAQELMARHRIDRAVLAASASGPRQAPVGRRLAVDDPYADAKAVLLGGIAAANGCRAVWSKSLGFSTVFGFAGELDSVEELFTSLLVQATVALRREGTKHDRVGRSRTTRFRRSFLVAFAVRIGQRLRATVDETVTAVGAETGTALVPILAERAAAADRAVEDAFPQMTSFSPSATDGEGWFAGTRFGDLADLGGGSSLTAATEDVA